MLTLIHSASHLWLNAISRALWQTSIAVLVVLAISSQLSRLSPKLRCWMWRLVFVKAIVAFAIPAIVALPVLPSMVAESQAEHGSSTYLPNTSTRIVNNHTSSAMTTDKVSNKTTEKQTSSTLLFEAWLLCLAIWVASQTRNMMMSWQLKKRAVLATTDEVDSKWLTAARVEGTSILTSPDIHRPMLLGLMKPAIMIPTSWLTASSNQIDLAISHELSHVKQKDVLWNVIAEVTKALLVINPLVWIAQKELRLAQEMEADKAAMHKTASSPKVYGNLLLWTVSQPGGNSSPIMSTGTADSYLSVKKRLLAMQKYQKGSSRATIIAALVLLVLSVMIVPAKLISKVSAENPGVKNEIPLVATERLTGKKAPLLDIVGIDGNMISLKDMAGKPIVLVVDSFAGPTPAPLTQEELAKQEQTKKDMAQKGVAYFYKCNDLAKVLQDVEKEYGDAINVVGIATGSISQVQAYASRFNFPIAMSTKETLNAYGFGGYQKTSVCVIKPDGTVRFHRGGYGVETEDIIRRLAKELS